MSQQELSGWMEYLSKEPPYSVEAQLASLSQIANNAMGGKLKYDDAFFTRYKVKQKEQQFVSQSNVMAAFKALSS